MNKEHARASICKRAAQPCGSFRVCSLSSVKKESFSGKFKQSFTQSAHSVRVGEISRFAHSVRVIKQLSTTKTTHRISFCALRSQHLLWQMCPSLSLFTTDYPPLSGRWNGIAFPYPSHFLPLYLPTKHRETTERSPRDERLKIAVNFDQNLQFSHLIPLAPTIHHCVNFSDIPCKVSLHFLNMSKITTSTISIA